MKKQKTLNDFYQWLACCNLFYKYWEEVKAFCDEHHLLLTDFLGNMDAEKPETLFWFESSPSGIFTQAQEKYTNWLNDENKQ